MKTVPDLEKSVNDSNNDHKTNEDDDEDKDDEDGEDNTIYFGDGSYKQRTWVVLTKLQAGRYLSQPDMYLE